jgi:hypothetical protein
MKMPAPLLQSQRHLAVHRLQVCRDEYKIWEDQISRAQGFLEWSAFAQRIGFEAALTAATMGLAGAVSRAILTAKEGAYAARMAGAVLEEGTAGRSLDLLAKFGRAADTPIGGAILSTTVSEAAANTIGRLFATAVFQNGVRWLAGDASWQGFWLSLAGSLVGVPGNPTSSTFAKWAGSPMLAKALQSGAVVSYQGLAAASVALIKGYAEASRTGSEMDIYLKSLKGAVPGLVRAKATATGIAASASVSAQEAIVGRAAKAMALNADYSSLVPFLARHFSSAEGDLKYLYGEYADACARYQIWYNLLQTYNNLERAVLNLTRRYPF